MRRKDREVTDFNKILQIVDKCDVIRLGLCDSNDDGKFPYIVPVNFSYEVLAGNQLVFYIHGAKAGRKYELLTKNKKCSFEMDLQLKIDYLYDCKDITTRYECVMGTATVEEISESEKEDIMQNKVLARWEEAKNFDWNKAALGRCGMFRITVQTISAKVNPLRGGAD